MALTPDDRDALRSAGAEEVRRRMRVYPDLPEGYDARGAEPDELEALGLPPRPDRSASPAAAELWERLLEPPLRRVEPEAEVIAEAGHPPPRLPPASNTGLSGAASATRWGTSRNWSGAVVRARDGGRFVLAGARWTIPTPEPPPGASAAAPPAAGSWRASMWVGLDGDRLASTSMPQMGTTSVIEPLGGALAARAYLWAQWWVRGREFGEVVLRRFPVAPGDGVLCLLHAASPTDVRFTLRVAGRPEIATLGWAAGEVTLPEGDPQPLGRAEAPVEGAAAVWIVERPATLPDPEVLFPLPAFGTAVFDAAVAAARVPGPPGTAPVAWRDLSAARLVRMAGVPDDGPQRTRWLSAPLAAPRGAGPLRVSYRPPG
jgi:hypothetical protein